MLVAELVDGRSRGCFDDAKPKVPTVDVAVGDLDRVDRAGGHGVEHEAALDLELGVLVDRHSSGEGTGGCARFDSSTGLMIPTSTPFGSATIA